MKTHTIKTPTAELLIVELPEGSEPLGLIGNSFFYYEKDMVKEDYPKSLTLATSYTLLGKPDEIREEDAKELVESKPIFGEEYRGMYHVYPKESKLFTASSVLSLLSLLESEIYWENPVKLFDMDNLLKAKHIAYEEIKKFNEAEQETFDRKRTLIFVKN